MFYLVLTNYTDRFKCSLVLVNVFVPEFFTQDSKVFDFCIELLVASQSPSLEFLDGLAVISIACCNLSRFAPVAPIPNSAMTRGDFIQQARLSDYLDVWFPRLIWSCNPYEPVVPHRISEFIVEGRLVKLMRPAACVHWSQRVQRLKRLTVDSIHREQKYRDVVHICLLPFLWPNNLTRKLKRHATSIHSKQQHTLTFSSFRACNFFPKCQAFAAAVSPWHLNWLPCCIFVLYVLKKCIANKNPSALSLLTSTRAATNSVVSKSSQIVAQTTGREPYSALNFSKFVSLLTLSMRRLVTPISNSPFTMNWSAVRICWRMCVGGSDPKSFSSSLVSFRSSLVSFRSSSLMSFCSILRADTLQEQLAFVCQLVVAAPTDYHGRRSSEWVKGAKRHVMFFQNSKRHEHDWKDTITFEKTRRRVFSIEKTRLEKTRLIFVCRVMKKYFLH